MGNFPHRELDVYKRAMEAISLITRITNAVPGKDGWLSRQIRRARVAAMLTKLGMRFEAEGIKKLGMPKKRRRTCTCTCTCS